MAPKAGRRRWVAIALVIAGLAAAFGLASHGAPAAGMSPRTVYAHVRAHTTFPFHRPAPLPGLVVDGAGVADPGRAGWAFVDYHTRAGDIVELAQGTQKHPTLLEAETGGKPSLGAVHIRGRVWRTYRNDDPILARVMPDGVTVVVRGGTGWATLRTVAAAVPE